MSNNSWIIITIVGTYLGLTTLIGFWQSRKIKEAREFGFTDLSPWQAATFLAGFTLGGASTYGVAGDTIKFGLTYLVWFPISVALGWWITGIFFSGPYFRLKGETLPVILGKRFDGKTRLAASLSTMIYTVFVIIIELYTLAMVIRAITPDISMPLAILISLVACTGTVAFSGILGASVTNMIHSGMMLAAFSLVLVFLWRATGGWENTIQAVLLNFEEIAKPGISKSVWLSPFGLGWGAVGQILLAKSGRLGGISTVSNLAASCRSEKDARKAFWWAGLISAIPPFLACSVGILTAAYLGQGIGDIPVYSAIGYAVGQLSPVLAGIFLAAIAAAILSTFSPLAVTFSTVFIEDIVGQFVKVKDKNKLVLYPLSIVLISAICAVYILVEGITDVMPFVFATAFPSTIPTTLVTLFGLYTKKVNPSAAFWAITLGVTISLTWGLLLNDPFGIPNIYIAFLIPLLICCLNYLLQSRRDRVSEPQPEPG